MCEDSRDKSEHSRDKRPWFAVRCVLRFDGLSAGRRLRRRRPVTYEERITLWRAGDESEAIKFAEAEAKEHAAIVGAEFAGFSDSYRLVDHPGVGAEVFSLMRDSYLSSDRYIDRYFDTGTERRHE
jgi:hypothetical protein